MVFSQLRSKLNDLNFEFSEADTSFFPLNIFGPNPKIELFTELSSRLFPKIDNEGMFNSLVLFAKFTNSCF